MNMCLESLAIKALHCLPAETAHNLALLKLRLATGTGIITTGTTGKTSYSFGKLHFANRLGMAAGFDKNGDAIDGLSDCGFSFVELGTVTPRPQPGNPKPRLFRVKEHQAIINRMGFNNKGIDYLVRKIQASQSTIIKGINIGKNKNTSLDNALEDYLYCLRLAYPVADYIVINISSPNTPKLQQLQFGNRLSQLLSGLARQRDKLARAHQKTVPLLVKISPDIEHNDLLHLINTIGDCSLDGMVAINTTTDKSLVVNHPLASENGGISGKPLRELALKAVSEISELLPRNCLLIGVGGISSAEDALAMRRAGADLVQIHSSFVYQGTQIIKQIISEL